MKVKPFLKWAGGKRGLLPQLLPLLPKEFNNYFEPFLGGGALFFELYSLGKIKKAYLSDKNPELINSYQVVKESPNELLKELEKFQKRHSKEFYYKVREWDRREDFNRIDPILRATRFIYLNKTCFNGVYRVNQKGYFNVSLGRYKEPKIFEKDNLLKASKALQVAVIKLQDFNEISPLVKKRDFIYLDPPYYPLTSTSNFTSYTKEVFLEKEQERLAKFFTTLAKRGVYLMQSNSNTSFIKTLYSTFNIEEVKATRSINSNPTKRGKVKEIVIRSY